MVGIWIYPQKVDGCSFCACACANLFASTNAGAVPNAMQNASAKKEKRKKKEKKGEKGKGRAYCFAALTREDEDEINRQMKKVGNMQGLSKSAHVCKCLFPDVGASRESHLCFVCGVQQKALSTMTGPQGNECVSHD